MCQHLPEEQRGPEHCEACREYDNIYWCTVVKPALNDAMRAIRKRRKLRKEVLAFAHLMEERLRANEHKGGWKDENPFWLLDRARDELRELNAVLHVRLKGNTVTPREIGAEAADAANFLLMIADVCGALDAAP
jgi:hypothetical protein